MDSLVKSMKGVSISSGEEDPKKNIITYKRPAIRFNTISQHTGKHDIHPGHFLYDIIRPGPVKPYKPPMYAMGNYDDYIASLKRNCKEMGIEFKQPNAYKDTYEYPPHTKMVHHIEYMDQIVVKLNVLKSGKIRVKIHSGMHALHEKYYKMGHPPPIKSVVSAYKALGYSEQVLNAITNKHEKRLKMMKKYGPKIDSIFEQKSSASKKKKKEKKEKEKEKEKEEIEIVEEEEPEDKEEDDEDEDEGMDVEIDEDEDEGGEQTEEVCFSDAE